MTEEMEVVSIIIVTIKESKMPGHKMKKKPMKKKAKQAKKAKKAKMRMY